MNHAPDSIFLDHVISVRKHITEGNDPGVVSNPRRSVGIQFDNTVHGLADDFEISFDRLAKNTVPAVVVKRSAMNQVDDELSCIADIVKILGDLRRHKVVAGFGWPLE